MGEMEGTRRTVAMTHEEVCCWVLVLVAGVMVWMVCSAMLGEGGPGLQLVANDNDLTRFRCRGDLALAPRPRL